MTNKEIVLEFYAKSQKPIAGEEDGYLQYRIYKGGRYGSFMRGHGGSIMIIKLSDDCIVKTNDLWAMTECWTKTIPNNVLEGTFINDWTEYQKYKNMTDEDIESYIY
jgi:hypothetical protein